jgi:flagellar basal body-associated protein FliL
MYRKMIKTIGILLVVGLLFTSCSAGKSASPTMSADRAASPAVAPSAPAAPMPAPSTPEGKASGGGWAGDAGTVIREVTGTSLPQADRKRIITADIQMQSVTFDEAVSAIAATVAKYSGYFENSSLYDNGYFNQGVKKRGASYSIRVPADQYLAFKQDILQSAHAVNVSESDQDVSEQFYDLESRLKTLRMQQDRYYALLEKADVMEDIVTLEKALADVQYQIEQYTTNLQKLSGRIDYATIRINLEEVYKVDDAKNMPTTLGGRIINALVNATKETINLMEDLLVGLVSLIPLLIILIPVGLIVFFLFRRNKRKKREKADQTKSDSSKET